MSDSVQSHRQKPTRLRRPWDSLGKNTGVGCHFLLQCMKVKSEREVAQLCPTPCDSMDCSPPGSSVHGIFQARVLEWGAIALSMKYYWFPTLQMRLRKLREVKKLKRVKELRENTSVHFWSWGPNSRRSTRNSASLQYVQCFWSTTASSHCIPVVFCLPPPFALGLAVSTHPRVSSCEYNWLHGPQGHLSHHS